ncbi:hypothetical protein Barb6_00348 [Bacteroidales bacterium Barb6]|nr:hypothetical protein Barb6_00348 [Bacteroidales bacterium Barb6]
MKGSLNAVTAAIVRECSNAGNRSPEKGAVGSCGKGGNVTNACAVKSIFTDSQSGVGICKVHKGNALSR